MTYAIGGTIQASDYNGFVASVNALWGSGAGDSGYGQTNPAVLGQVTQNTTVVTALQWSTLIARIDSMCRHQSNVSAGITAPASGNPIAFINTLISQINTITTNRLSTAGTGTATTASVSNTVGWTTTRQLEMSLSWANAAAMRYFFNAGGRVTFTGVNSALSGNTKSTDWDALLGNGTTGCGTMRIFSTTSDRTAGSGTTTIYNQNLGYYDLNANNQVILRQASTTATGGYSSNFATFSTRLNTTSWSTASVLYVNMTLTDSAPDGLNDTVTGTTTLTASAIPPWSTWIGNTWGAVTIATTIAG